MHYIKDIKLNDEFNETYLVKSVSKSVSKNNLTYYVITLCDKTGQIPLKIFETKDFDVSIFKPNAFINGFFTVTTFNDKLELRVKKAMNALTYNINDYIVTTNKNIDDLTKQLEGYINKIKDKDIKTVIDYLYKENKNEITSFPAAKSVHHAFKGGLIHHIVSMLEVGEFLSSHYDNVNKDLIYGSIILHDIGKIKELNGAFNPDYTKEGHLLGHIVIASNLIVKAAIKNNIENSESILLLQHCVLASHGKLEYGSPVLGEIKEAILLNCIDDLDAKMMIFDNNTKDLNPGEFSKAVMTLDGTKLYKIKK